MNSTVSILETAISVNGKHILVAVRTNLGELPIGTVLSSQEGKQWRVHKKIEFQHKRSMQEEKEDVYFYEFDGIGHRDRPLANQELEIA